MINFKQFLSEAVMDSRVGNSDADRHYEKYLNKNTDSLVLAKGHEGIPTGSQLPFVGKKVVDGRYHAVLKYQDRTVEVPIHKISKPKDNAKFNDEHAFSHVWNHFVRDGNYRPGMSKEEMMQSLNRSMNDKRNPLHFDNVSEEGFSGGKKTAAHKSAYNQEMQNAVGSIHAMVNHESFGDAVAKRLSARVTGTEKGNLSDIWNKNGAKNATSKADVIIGGKPGERDYYPVSLKKGDSQLMSAGPEETTSTYEHAINEYTKSGNVSEDQKKSIMDRVRKLHDLSNSFRTTPKEKHKDLVKQGQSILDDIHKEHPDLIHHVAYEASTGHGKFGQNQSGSARYLVTQLSDGAHIHDTETNREPIKVKGAAPRFASPKEAGRTGNVKLDYTASRLKPDQVSSAPAQQAAPQPQSSYPAGTRVRQAATRNPSNWTQNQPQRPTREISPLEQHATATHGGSAAFYSNHEQKLIKGEV